MEKRRSALSPAERAVQSRQICERLQQEAEKRIRACSKHKLTIFSYIPFRCEADVLPFLEWCWSRGHQILGSRTNASDKSMTLYPICSLADTETGAYGIREPKAELTACQDLRKLDIVIVPGVVFDQAMGRIGYGGGYYDRWWAACEAFLLHNEESQKANAPGCFTISERSDQERSPGLEESFSVKLAQQSDQGCASFNLASDGSEWEEHSDAGLSSGSSVQPSERRAACSRPLLLAPAFDIQMAEQVPMEAHDLRVDRIVTPSRIWTNE